MRQILRRGGLFGLLPYLWAAPKRPTLNRVNFEITIHDFSAICSFNEKWIISRLMEKPANDLFENLILFFVFSAMVLKQPLDILAVFLESVIVSLLWDNRWIFDLGECLSEARFLIPFHMLLISFRLFWKNFCLPFPNIVERRFMKYLYFKCMSFFIRGSLSLIYFLNRLFSMRVVFVLLEWSEA